MGISHRLGKLVAPAPRQTALSDPSAALDAANDDLRRSVNTLARQVGLLRGLVHQQGDMLTEALQRAGWQSDEEVAQQRSLHRALRALDGHEDIIVGPWTGEVGFELLYWIPFLGWLAEQGLGSQRVTVISRGGAAPWYRHLTTQYVDLLELMTPDEFRERTAGPKKQVDASRDFDSEIVETVQRRLGLEKAGHVHPSSMFRLFSALWRKRAGVDLVESFTSYRPLSLPDADSTAGMTDLPSQYVVCKFYFSKAFPDTAANRAFAADLIRTINRDVPVVLLSTALQLDEHSDFKTNGSSGVYLVDSHAVPHRNLEVQTRLIAGARGFVGTYGGFSYLAPFYGVRSVSFFSRRAGFESHHLQLADRVFDQLLPGGFVALDRRAHELVEPAIARWTHAPNETVHA
jgi:hypothetical protein